MWVRLAKEYAVAYIAEPLAKYRVHYSSITGTRGADEFEKTQNLILENIFNDTELGPSLSTQRPKAHFSLYLRLANMAYERRETKTTRRYLFKSLKMYPEGIHQRPVAAMDIAVC